jgi:hypothetical protein
MSTQQKEIEKMKGEITKEIYLVFKANMKIFDWDIPENDDRKSAELIVSVMKEAVDELGQEVASGKFDTY